MKTHRSRIFRIVSGLAIATSPMIAAAQANPLSARQLTSRIIERAGVPAPNPTVDTFKAGDADATVRGIAVTMMATLDVLERAAEKGHNLIITHEPTYYGHRDDIAALEKENDAVLAAKRKF
ncbi:MAG TPA: Nif3-like dinuclear metal center hexameric protein, partial [Gemmatimonadaceae bacterium]|nr:Nif3-like dinuclear metal center hexameric protein [Gemmatimonadaceae bacterium]